MSQPTQAEPIKKVPFEIKRAKANIYQAYLRIVMSMSKGELSQTEVDIVTECHNLCSGEFSTEGREIICNRLGMSKANLNNYIKKIRDKGVIDSNNRLYKPFLLEVSETGNYLIQIKIAPKD